MAEVATEEALNTYEMEIGLLALSLAREILQTAEETTEQTP